MTEFNQTLAPLLLLVIGVPLVLVWVGSRSMIRARSTVTRVFAGVVAACSVAVLSLVGWWLVLVVPDNSGVVASGMSPGEREFCVVQTYSGDWAEPYQVSLYVRDDAGMWRWHYLEHEDFAWQSARVEITGGDAVVYRNGERFAEFELASGPAEPEVIKPNAYNDLKTLSPELTFEDVAQLHHEKFGP